MHLLCTLFSLLTLLLYFTIVVRSAANIKKKADYSAESNEFTIDNDWWEIEQNHNAAFFTSRGHGIYLKRADYDANGIHSCYEFKLEKSRQTNQIIEQGGNVISGGEENERHSRAARYVVETGSFCYPSVMVTGVRKCGTSALYKLLTLYSGVIVGEVKENCPFLGSRSIIQYFNSLPPLLSSGELHVGGCVDLNGNMLMRKILREPNTFYVVGTKLIK